MLGLIIFKDVRLLLDIIIEFKAVSGKCHVGFQLPSARDLAFGVVPPGTAFNCFLSTLVVPDTQGGCNAKRKRLLRRMEAPKAQYSELSDHIP